MKTLLIDNGSTLTKKLKDLIPGDVELINFSEIHQQNTDDYGCLVLSGSSKYPVIGNDELFVAELQLIRRTTKPMIGICLGHELIAHAFNSELFNLDKQHTGTIKINFTENSPVFNGKTIDVYENHGVGVSNLGTDLIALAYSDHAIAAFKHRQKPIYGLQFHPEHHRNQQQGDELFLEIFNKILE